MKVDDVFQTILLPYLDRCVLFNKVRHISYYSSNYGLSPRSRKLCFTWQSLSPDFNPIEHVCDIIGRKFVNFLRYSTASPTKYKLFETRCNKQRSTISFCRCLNVCRIACYECKSYCTFYRFIFNVRPLYSKKK